MSEKREHEDDKKSSSDDECVGPSLSEATDTVVKKKRKSMILYLIGYISYVFLIFVLSLKKKNNNIFIMNL